MAQARLTVNAIEQLKGGFGGEVISPSDPGYDAARKVWNGTIDRMPALVARCATSADVAAALRFARQHGLLVAVRGGGHSFPGHSTCDDGLVVDLSPMKEIDVDPASKTAIAGGGVLWGALNDATQEHGLAVTGGLVSTTGIAGLTLGGGIGWLMRRYGLSCDNLLEVEIVTADGTVRKANDRDSPDLFWAVRGGGGNFGVVTKFTYRLHEVGPLVFFALYHYGPERGPEILSAFRAFSDKAPDELTPFLAYTNLPPLPFVPPDLVGAAGWLVAVFSSGDFDAAREAVTVFDDLRPQVQLAERMPYAITNTLTDASVPYGSLLYLKGHYADDLTDELIDALITSTGDRKSAFSEIHVHPLLGAIGRIGEDATAYSNRSSGYAINLIGAWEQERDGPSEIAWVRQGWAAIKPYCAGAYVNFMDAGDSVESAYSGAKYMRLAEIKQRYDPDNMFRFNQNIKPLTVSGR
jgi:FAD/FMN-containing dehydrogenase